MRCTSVKGVHAILSGCKASFAASSCEMCCDPGGHAVSRMFDAGGAGGGGGGGDVIFGLYMLRYYHFLP